jgi:hypothetical protein
MTRRGMSILSSISIWQPHVFHNVKIKNKRDIGGGSILGGPPIPVTARLLTWIFNSSGRLIKPVFVINKIQLMQLIKLQRIVYIDNQDQWMTFLINQKF